MTISSNVRKAGPFTGNGSASAFPFYFKVFQAADLLVVRLDTSNSIETTLALTTDYTVSLNADQDSNPGGTVTLMAGALATGFTLTITSDIANLQPTDITNQGGFYPEVIEDSLDRATIQIQQLQEEADRALTLPLSTPSSVSTELPPPSANEFLAWNPTATALQNVDSSTLATIVAYGTANADLFSGTGLQTIFTLSANPGNQAVLDVSISGVTQRPGIDYTWTGGTNVTFTTEPPAGTNNILARYFQGLPGIVTRAEDVTYTPAGTGAVSRTVQAKLREFISVKDFGAVGDGVTDDTAAIQAAIDYCTNLSNRKQTLYFPANNAAAYYKITAPLVVNGRLNMLGDGEFSTTIYAVGMTSGQFMVDFNNNALDVVYFGGMDKITLRSDNAQPTGIRLRNASYWTFKNVQLYGLTTGIYITGTNCFSNFFEQVTGYQISSYTVQMDSFTGGGQYMFSGCTFTGSDGFYITNTAETDGLCFYDCNFEQCVVTDMVIYGSVRGLTVSGCRSEGLNGGASILLRPDAGKVVQGVSITSNFWQTDSGNAYAVSIGGGAGDVKGFSITGNNAGYIGFLGFVHLNGGGESGVISGNYCENAPVVANGAPRAGVVIYANSNSSGALPEYWGLASWKVKQSSFTATATGMTTSPTGTVNYSVVGNTVTLDIPNISGTSNAITFTLTGGPTDIRPATEKDIPVRITDNGTQALGFVRVKTTGVLELYSTIAGNSFTGSGTKAISQISITYTLA